MEVIRNAALTIAILSLGLVAAQVSANEADQIRSMVVEYGDLNIATADGATALYQRFKHAAREVCKKPSGAFGDRAVFLHCYYNALAHGVRDLGNDRVTALYNVDTARLTK